MTRRLLGLAAGALAGALWFEVVGCWTGACYMTGSLPSSGAYFAVLGWILGGGGQELSALVSRRA